MSEDFRIVFLGQAAFGESVLNALVDRGETIVAAFCPPDKEGKPSDPVKTAAEKHGIPVYQFPRLRDQEAIDTVAKLHADLGVMAFVTDIVPPEIINAPKRGAINFHPSLLPKHRGPSSINWPIIQGEKQTGLTIFWPDEGLDTGPILLQREVEIGPDDTLGAVYFEKIFDLGVQAMCEAVEMVKHGTAPRIEQDESEATYESWCKPEDVVIDWTMPVDEIYNMIRGSDPSPGAGSTYNGASVRFYSASKSAEELDAKPGTVVSVKNGAFTIAAKNGAITVSRVQPENSKKMPASEWIEAVNLSVGDTFGGENA